MSLFWRRRKIDNTAAGVLPGVRPPMNTTVHNHGANWVGIVIAAFFCFLALLPVFWFVLVFLFEQIGSSRPEREAAWLIVSIPAAGVIVWLAHWLILAVLDNFHSFRLEVEREITRREELKLLAAQTAIEPGRMNEEDYDFARVILAVMMQAYDWLEKEKYSRFPGRWRPWSLASSLKTAEQIGIKLTQAQANGVSVWLHQRGIITSPDGGQITKKFPNLSSVRALLDNEFGKPIVVVSPALRDNRGFKHI